MNYGVQLLIDDARNVQREGCGVFGWVERMRRVGCAGADGLRRRK